MKNEDMDGRIRSNIIAFRLTDEEKRKVETMIRLAGIPKGEYYRKAVLGEKIEFNCNRYKSARLAVELKKMYIDLKNHQEGSYEDLLALLSGLLDIWNIKEGDDDRYQFKGICKEYLERGGDALGKG